MDITGKIEEVNQSDSLLLVVFYADWSPHCEWIEPLLHEFEKPVNIVRVNIESNRKVADAYEIEIAPSFVLQRKGMKDLFAKFLCKGRRPLRDFFSCRRFCTMENISYLCQTID